MSKLQPMNGYLILKPIEEEEQTYGNIVIPDLGKEKPEIGIVVATSGTYNFHSDKVVPSALQEGDKVFFYTDGLTEAINENREFYENRLFELLQLKRNEDPMELIGAINKDLNVFLGSKNEVDHVTQLQLTNKKAQHVQPTQ